MDTKESQTMNKEKKNFLMQDVRSMNIASAVSGVGFLLYVGAAALEWILVKDILAVIFGLIAVWTFLSVITAREKDKEAVSLNLLWGTGALAIMLGACAVLGIKLRLGL